MWVTSCFPHEHHGKNKWMWFDVICTLTSLSYNTEIIYHYISKFRRSSSDLLPIPDSNFPWISPIATPHPPPQSLFFIQKEQGCLGWLSSTLAGGRFESVVIGSYNASFTQVYDCITYMTILVSNGWCRGHQISFWQAATIYAFVLVDRLYLDCSNHPLLKKWARQADSMDPKGVSQFFSRAWKHAMMQNIGMWANPGCWG